MREEKYMRHNKYYIYHLFFGPPNRCFPKFLNHCTTCAIYRVTNILGWAYTDWAVGSRYHVWWADLLQSCSHRWSNPVMTMFNPKLWSIENVNNCFHVRTLVSLLLIVPWKIWWPVMKCKSGQRIADSPNQLTLIFIFRNLYLYQTISLQFELGVPHLLWLRLSLWHSLGRKSKLYWERCGCYHKNSNIVKLP